MGFFEQNPIVFLGAVVVTVEVWLRIRTKIFVWIRRPVRRPVD